MSAEASREPRRSRLPRTVIALGVASFFNDFGSEMSFPLLPALLVSLGAGPTYLGVVEGIADATASLLKLVAGQLSDRFGNSKLLVTLGYGLPSIARPLLAFATAPLHVLGIRVTDRVGKGLRTAPRDALIAGSVSAADSGRAFGFHRALDHSGAVVGPLCAAALLALGVSVEHVFLAALVPSVLALVAVAAVRPLPRAPALQAQRTESAPPDRKTRTSFQGYLAIVALFAFANSSDAFLLLRAHELGVPDAQVLLLWTVLHVSRAGCTVLGGKLADRFSRARLLALGWIVFALCYLGMGFAHAMWHVWTLFVVYGLHTGICEPAERALVRDLAAAGTRGRSYGLFHGVIGACAIPAGLSTGWIWQRWGASAALSSSAALAVLAAALLVRWERRAAQG
ncbi:MAG TPA: MFS transporter [Planctomycetota bacterium]|nr:MFS transporter [Planctomycetota bacterium]